MLPLTLATKSWFSCAHLPACCYYVHTAEVQLVSHSRYANCKHQKPLNSSTYSLLYETM